MSFLFVDRILELEPGRRVVAEKDVTPDEPFVENRALISCIVGEAVGQAGAWSVLKANDFTRRPVAGIVGAVEIPGEARLGDTIRLETTIDSMEDDAIHYHGVATVRGAPIFRIIDGLGPLLPMTDFNDPAEVRAQFERIRSGQGVGPKTPSPRVLFENGTLTVPVGAPFFRDHFPRKPVLPMSLLLEALLRLAGRPNPRAIRNIKMNDFVPPGSVVTGLVKPRGANLQLRAEVDGRRVCVAEAEYA